MKLSSLLVFIFLFALNLRAEIIPIQKIPERERYQQMEKDLLGVMTYRKGLQSVIAFMNTRTDLFAAEKLEKGRLLSGEQKQEVWNTWKSFLDYVIALDSIGKTYRGFFMLSGESKDRAFLISYAGFLAQYRFALEFIQIAEKDPGFAIQLNEPVPEVGLQKGGYTNFKIRFLNVARATEFTAMKATFKMLDATPSAQIVSVLQDDSNYLWKAGKGKGQILTVKNAVDVLKQSGFTAYFPVQAKVSEWSGDTKVYRHNRSLISQKQISDMLPQLQPGDILLERREWYLSNVGLPGFWPHAALYIGTAEERSKFFDDPVVKEWVRQQGNQDGVLDSALRFRYPSAYRLSTKMDQNHHPRVLEAISEGVSFTTLEHSADCDSLAVLRPRLSKKERAIAIFRAFQYAGRPYDFNFDFLTDSALVCTELIFKAYEPATQFTGLRLPVSEILGRKATPANDFVRQFDEQWGLPLQQTDLVIFLDGDERRQTAVAADLAVFRKSWKRPKWHIVTQ